ncbi:MAG: TetR/AcrR family transcriptional regulator [Chloroflexota bacterium]
MSPRPDVSEERRNQIIESAIKVLAREGFANTRMDDVAVESGLSKGLLYWYFKSKEEIIIAIADVLFGAALHKLQNFPLEGQTARALLENYIEIYIADLRGLLKFTPIIYEFYALAFRNRAVRQVMQEYLHRFVAILEPLVQRGIDTGEFASGNAQQITIAIGAAFEGTLLLWAYDPEMVQVEAQLRVVMAVLLNGLEASK